MIIDLPHSSIDEVDKHQLKNNSVIIDVLYPVFSIDLDNRGSFSYNSHDFNDSRIVVVSDYPNGFPELKDGDILFRYGKYRGYILKNGTFEPDVNIEALVEKWSTIGFLDGLDESVYNQYSYCYETASNILINNDCKNILSNIILPIIRRILKKYDTSEIDYSTCKKFVENLITDYDSFSKEQYPHIESMLTRLIGNDKIDIELEIVTLYCEINDFNKILNKK